MSDIENVLIIDGPDQVLVLPDSNQVVLQVETTGPQGIPGRLVRPPVKVPYSDTINLDCAVTDTFDILLQGNPTISLSGAVDGQRVFIRFIQDDVGGRVITSWAANVKFGADILYIQLSVSPNKTDYVGVIYQKDIDTFEVVGFARGY